MGHWTREDGEIKLPSAEFARVRQAVADAVTKESDAVYEKTQEFWKDLTAAEKADSRKYEAALWRFIDKHTPRGRYGSFDDSTLPETFWDAVANHRGKPARVQKKDLSYPTNRDLAFTGSAGEGWYDLTFDRKTNTAKWYVEEGKNAVERSRESAAGKALFAALPKVKWTRGTGGVISGNDENHSEARGDGFGSNYVNDGYGPIGAAEASWNTEPYVMADGTRVTRNDFEKVAKSHRAAQKREANKRYAAAAASSGQQGRVGRGVPAGGQYTGHNRTEYGGTLGFYR